MSASIFRSRQAGSHPAIASMQMSIQSRQMKTSGPATAGLFRAPFACCATGLPQNEHRDLVRPGDSVTSFTSLTVSEADSRIPQGALSVLKSVSKKSQSGRNARSVVRCWYGVCIGGACRCERASSGESRKRSKLPLWLRDAVGGRNARRSGEILLL